jgi:hypothetical protein
VGHFVDKFKPQYGRDLDGEYLNLVNELKPWEPQTPGYENEECILPSVKSKKIVFGDWGVGEEGEFGFNLPGHSASYESCGDFKMIGCLEHNPAHVEKVMQSCFRASCPVCYEKWMAKEAHAIEYRLGKIKEKMKWLGGEKHIIVSVPIHDWYLVEKDYPKLRRIVYKKAVKVGFKGGCLIFHHLRRKCRYCDSIIDYNDKCCHKCGSTLTSWYFSPHFHLIGFGWIDNVAQEYLDSGYVIKNLGYRDSVFSTAFYQLSHAAIHEKYHTVTWFGVCAYNKVKVEPDTSTFNRCPVCGGILKPVRWVGLADSCPVNMDERSVKGFLVDPGGWEYCGWADKNYIMMLEVAR